MKSAAREKALATRRGLPLEERVRLSEIIQNSVLNLEEYREAEIIICYMPIKNEVDTLQIIKTALEEKKRIALPRVNRKTGSIEIYEIENLDEDLEEGSFGIREPKRNESRRLKYSDIDLVLVPGVAFDCHGSRIGYGGGHYDWLLKRTNATKIALAYEVQISCEDLPCEPHHDVCVDKIVTETRVIKCGGEVK